MQGTKPAGQITSLRGNKSERLWEMGREWYDRPIALLAWQNETEVKERIGKQKKVSLDDK